MPLPGGESCACGVPSACGDPDAAGVAVARPVQPPVTTHPASAHCRR